MNANHTPDRPLSMAAIRKIWAARRRGEPAPTFDPAPRATAHAADDGRRGKQFDGAQRPDKSAPVPADVDQPLVRARYLERHDSADDRIVYWSPTPINRHPFYASRVFDAAKRGELIRRLARIGCFSPNPMMTTDLIRRMATANGVGPEGFADFAEMYAGAQS